jgi:hypothetical protein
VKLEAQTCSRINRETIRFEREQKKKKKKRNEGVSDFEVRVKIYQTPLFLNLNLAHLADSEPEHGLGWLG